MMSMLTIFTSLILVLCLKSSVSTSNILLVNILTSNANQNAIDFLESLSKEQLIETRILIYVNAEINDGIKSKFNKYGTLISNGYHPSLQNFNIGIKDPPSEYVTSIINGIDEVLKSSPSENRLISIAFYYDWSSIVKPLASFQHIFTFTDDVLLLDKTRKLSSLSDWHDLRVLGLSLADNSKAILWFQSFRDVYLHHADREAFNLLYPRPALLEASIRHRNDISINYLTTRNIHVEHDPHRNISTSIEKYKGLEENSNNLYLSIKCYHPFNKQRPEHACLQIDESKSWINHFSRGIKNNLKDGHGGEGYKQNILSGMSRGLGRFRNLNSTDTPIGFCWETG